MLYVPLRFIGEALGAHVWFDNQHSLVVVTTDRRGRGDMGQAPDGMMHHDHNARQVAIDEVHLDYLRPENDAVVATKRPEISAQFDHEIDPNTVRMFLDGLDVSTAATRSPKGLIYVSPSPLQAMRHEVRVIGKDARGLAFDRTWHFTSGESAPRNSVEIFEPKPADDVHGGGFIVRGRTMPNARMHLVAGAADTIEGAYVFHAGTYVGDVIADANGRFSQQVQLDTPSGSSIGLSVVSVDPQTRESAERRITLHVR